MRLIYQRPKACRESAGRVLSRHNNTDIVDIFRAVAIRRIIPGIRLDIRRAFSMGDARKAEAHDLVDQQNGLRPYRCQRGTPLHTAILDGPLLAQVH